MSLWRKFTAAYSWLLSWLLVISVAILIIPVSLQIFSRYTALIPSYIWTEEMARFLFIWMIMIGAMIGVREGTHFEVDLWPTSQTTRRGRSEAASRVLACSSWRWYSCGPASSSRASPGTVLPSWPSLPLWMIHIAWPMTGFTWLVFLGEQMWDNLTVLARRQHA